VFNPTPQTEKFQFKVILGFT